MFGIYDLKPRFQAVLRPVVHKCAKAGITANSVSVTATAASVLLGGWLLAGPKPRHFLLLPLWMFLRMALNVIDGMLAREHSRPTVLGAYLNELSDPISDAALYLPFVAVAPFGWANVGAVIFLSALSEMAGIMGQAVGGVRRYDGPMGKSDRAFLFGALGLWLGVAGSFPDWAFWIMPLTAAAIALNIFQRIRNGIAQV
ncbi:MAG: CDP-alcohol phosphatidyltransferase family protein [Rhodomicrobium sp.]